MRQTFIVSYDIARSEATSTRIPPHARLGRSHPALGVPLRADARELVELRSNLVQVIHHTEDQVLFVDVGPVEGRGSTSIRSIGKAYSAPERCAMVV